MKVLVTGAFGNIGISTVLALRECGHTVRCFDLPTKTNRQKAKSLGGEVEVSWGDLRKPEEVARAVAGQDVVIHLAFIIPKLSATGVESESAPEWAEAINVGGTCNLLNAMRAQPISPKLLFASSIHVYGYTQHLPPPRTTLETPMPVEHYAHHKITCEEMVRESGLTWAILRLAASLPISIKLDRGMFDVPLENRIEYVHTRDVGVAFAHAIITEEVWGKVWLIGGGKSCQFAYGDMIRPILEAIGVGALPAEAFGTKTFATDWFDSEASEEVLHYQSRTIDDYVEDMRRQLGWRVPMIHLFRPLVRAWLLNRSPYWRSRIRLHPAHRSV